MRPYILATAINISLLISLFLIGTTIRNDYGIFFGLCMFLLTIIYTLTGLFVFFEIYNIQKLLARHCGICNDFLLYSFRVPIKYN